MMLIFCSALWKGGQRETFGSQDWRAWFSLTELELLATHARRGLERQIKTGAEDRAGITWFDAITKFMFANKITRAKITAGKKNKERNQGQRPHRKSQMKTAGEDLEKEVKSRDKSQGDHCGRTLCRISWLGKMFKGGSAWDQPGRGQQETLGSFRDMKGAKPTYGSLRKGPAASSWPMPPPLANSELSELLTPSLLLTVERGESRRN